MADLDKGMRDRARRLTADEKTSGMVTGPVWDGEEPAGQMPSRSKFAHGGKIAMGKNAAKRLDQYARGGAVKRKSGKTTINIIIGDKEAAPPAPPAAVVPPPMPPMAPPMAPPIDPTGGAGPGPVAMPPVGPMNRGGSVGFKKGGCVRPGRAFGGRTEIRAQGSDPEPGKKHHKISAASARGRKGLKTDGCAEPDADDRPARVKRYAGGRVGYDSGGVLMDGL